MQLAEFANHVGLLHHLAAENLAVGRCHGGQQQPLRRRLQLPGTDSMIHYSAGRGKAPAYKRTRERGRERERERERKAKKSVRAWPGAACRQPATGHRWDGSGWRRHAAAVAILTRSSVKGARRKGRGQCMYKQRNNCPGCIIYAHRPRQQRDRCLPAYCLDVPSYRD